MASILVLYHSQQAGNTHAMAEAVATGASTGKVDVTLINTYEQPVDMETFRAADAVAFGTPDYYSYFAGTLKVFLDEWYFAKKENPVGLSGKPVALFLSHGGGGAARGPFVKIFSRIGTQVGELIESQSAPTSDILDACRALGQQLAEAVA